MTCVGRFISFGRSMGGICLERSCSNVPRLFDRCLVLPAACVGLQQEFGTTRAAIEMYLPLLHAVTARIEGNPLSILRDNAVNLRLCAVSYFPSLDCT